MIRSIPTQTLRRVCEGSFGALTVGSNDVNSHRAESLCECASLLYSTKRAASTDITSIIVIGSDGENDGSGGGGGSGGTNQRRKHR